MRTNNKMDKLEKFYLRRCYQMYELWKTYQWNLNSLQELVDSFKQLEEFSLTLEWDKRKKLDTIIQNCYVEIMKIVKNFEKASKKNLFLY